MSTWIKKEKGLFKKLKFKSTKQLENFIFKLKIISDAMNHHADYQNSTNKILEIYLLTHDSNQITQKDYELADKIDELFSFQENYL